jgi:hypothetical protein
MACRRWFLYIFGVFALLWLLPVEVDADALGSLRGMVRHISGVEPGSGSVTKDAWAELDVALQGLECIRDDRDDPGVDVLSLPEEVVKRGGGDCEDIALFVISWLVKHGAPKWSVGVLFYRVDGEASGHAVPIHFNLNSMAWEVVECMTECPNVKVKVVSFSSYVDLSMMSHFGCGFFVTLGMDEDSLVVWKRVKYGVVVQELSTQLGSLYDFIDGGG